MSITSLYNGILTNTDRFTNSALASNNEISSEKSLSFKKIINDELEKLNNVQIKADELVLGFTSGQVEDLHTVLIAAEEARLSLETAVQVRNKCVEAYKEINNMQL